MTDGSAEPDDERHLSIGVLCDGPQMAAWQCECIRHIQALPFARIDLLVMNDRAGTPPRPGAWTRLRKKLSSGLLLWRVYERFVLDRKSAANALRPLPRTLQAVPRVHVTPLRIGKFRQAFGPDALQAVAAYSPDVLLRFGFGILTGEILKLPRYGVWSFHHGDPERFRGAPPGFWEIHNAEPVTGVILQRLTEELDGGAVLHAGWFKTNSASYPKSLDRILFGAAHFVARTLTDLSYAADGVLHETPIENPGPIYRYPRTGAVLKFLTRSTAAWFKDQYVSLFRHQQWNVGVINQSPQTICRACDGTIADASKVQWLTEPKGRFLADPFISPEPQKGGLKIIAEDFCWKRNLGQISTAAWPGNEELQPAIRSEHHLSYPYTLRYADEAYCIPECAESGEVALYRFLGAEGRWRREKVLIPSVRLLDPTIFKHEGRWWLFCTDALEGPNEVLRAWYADELTGDWKAHAANPLKVDVRGARPAGPPFLVDGLLMRPAQDCSRIYGGAITFNRILRLTPHEFAEEPTGKLMPDRTHYPAGLHTICGAGEQSVVDGARWTFIAPEFVRAVRKKLGVGRER